MIQQRRTFRIVVSVLCLLFTATTQAQTLVQSAFDAVSAKRSNFNVSSHKQVNSVINISTSRNLWRDKDARQLIDRIYRAFEEDTAQRVSFTRIDANSQLAGKRYVRISVPAGEATLGGDNENLIVGRFRFSDGKETAEVTYGLQWHEVKNGAFQLRMVEAATILPNATSLLSHQEKEGPNGGLYKQIQDFVANPVINGAPSQETEWDNRGKLAVWERTWSIHCHESCKDLFDVLIHNFEAYKDEPSFDQFNAHKAQTVGFAEQLESGQRLYIETREGGQSVSVEFPAGREGLFYKYGLAYVKANDSIRAYAFVQLTTEHVKPKTPTRDTKMETLLNILSNEEWINKVPVDCSNELLYSGVSLEALRAKAQADYELILTMRGLRAEETGNAEEVYRETLAQAKQNMNQTKDDLRKGYEKSKESHSAALRAGTIHSNEYAKRMQATSDNYATNLRSITKQYSTTVSTATETYNSIVARINTQYGPSTTLFPDGEPAEAVENAFRELLKAYSSASNATIEQYVFSKLKRLITFAAPEMSPDARQRWKKALPVSDKTSSLIDLLKETTH